MTQDTVTLLDDASLDALQARLYPRLKEALLVTVRQEREQAPPYYEQFVGSEVRRLEEAIKWNGQRIEETSEQLNRRIEDLRVYMDQRFGQVDRRFGQVDQRFEQVDQRFERVDQRFDHLEKRLDEMNVRFRNWALATTAFLGVLITVLSFLLR